MCALRETHNVKIPRREKESKKDFFAFVNTFGLNRWAEIMKI